MFLRKQGYPEEGELVLCTVTNIYHHSVFVDLDEYGRSGLIHISEISPGRIRNLREFVAEGKKIVCVVLRINKEKGHIDLSLRRVNESQKRRKLSEIKMEQTSEKIVEQIAKKYKKEPKQFYDQVMAAISKEYRELRFCFVDVANGAAKLIDLGVDKKSADDLTEMITTRMKPQEVEIRGDLKITSYAPDGIERIKGTLLKIIAEDKEITLKYKGAGAYLVAVKSLDFKDAERRLKKAIDTAKHMMGETVLFERKEAT